MVMQLATREVQVSQDEEEGDDEDGETWLRASRAAVGAACVGFCSSLLRFVGSELSCYLVFWPSRLSYLVRRIVISNCFYYCCPAAAATAG